MVVKNYQTQINDQHMTAIILHDHMYVEPQRYFLYVKTYIQREVQKQRVSLQLPQVEIEDWSSIISFQWASYQMRKIAGCACAGNAGNVFPRHQLHRKLLVIDLRMHHGTCVTHVPWCMSRSITRGNGEIIPDTPGACATRNFPYLARDPWGLMIPYDIIKLGHHRFCP